MNETVLSRNWRIVLLIAFALVLFWRLGAWAPLDPTEARYAEIAREMFRSGDFLHPEYLGVHHYHKPPLTYWITAAGYAVFGVSTFAARFFLQIAFLLQCLLVYAMARRLGAGRSGAWTSVLAWISMLIGWISVRDLSTDAYLNLFVLATSWALLEYDHSGRARHLYGAALLGGLGFLTKITELPVYMGPIAIALWWRHPERWRWSWHFVGALGVFAAVSLSWFLVLESEGIHVLRYVLFYQSVVRYAADEFHRSKPFLFYLELAPALAFPWAFVAVHAVARRLRREGPGLFREWALLFAGFAWPILFFSFSHSKLILYVLPAFPFLALYVPRFLEELPGRALRVWWAVQLVVMAALVAALLVLSARYQGPLLACAVVLALAQVAIAVAKGTPLPARMVSSAVAFVLSIVAFVPGVLAANPDLTRSTRPVVERIEELGLGDRPVYLIDEYLPSVAFQLDRTAGIAALELERELQFEPDEGYRRWYFRLRDPGEPARLLEAVRTPSVLTGRAGREDRIPPEVREAFGHRERIGRWVLYY